jgi:hypothetical protein
LAAKYFFFLAQGITGRNKNSAMLTRPGKTKTPHQEIPDAALLLLVVIIGKLALYLK